MKARDSINESNQFVNLLIHARVLVELQRRREGSGAGRRLHRRRHHRARAFEEVLNLRHRQSAASG